MGPTDVPSGTTAKPQCALHSSQGEQFCALMCNPNTTNTCGTDASCKPISGEGICTYDDSPPPPSSDHWVVDPSASFEEMSVAISLTFANPMIGWVGGGDNNIGAMIKKTTDGGKTWEIVYPGNQSQPKFDIFLAAAAKSKKNVVVGGVIFQTYSTDGYYFNASIGDYLIPSQDAEVIPGGEFALISTSNKCNGVSTSFLGKFWKCFDTGLNATLFPARYGSFPTKSTWYVTAGTWPQNTSSSRFRSVTQKIRYDKHMGKMEFLDKIEHQNSDDDSFSALIAKTTDSGATWTTVYQNISDFYFNDIDCISADHCVACAEGNSTHIFLTMDGGKTWDEVLYDNDPTHSLMRVSMVSETEVWVTGGQLKQFSSQGRFWHSIDGGKTFKLEFIKGFYIIDIDMIDATHGFAIGIASRGGLQLIKYKTPTIFTLKSHDM